MAQQVWCHHRASGSPSVPASHISSTQNSTFHIKNPHKTRSNSGLIKISSLNRHSKSILLAQKRSRRWGWRFQVPVLTCWQGTVTDLCDQKLPPVLPQHTQVLAASAHLHHPPLQGGTGPPHFPISHNVASFTNTKFQVYQCGNGVISSPLHFVPVLLTHAGVARC